MIYTEVALQPYILRKFACDIDAVDLVWHQDEFDRMITVIDGQDWHLQMDNKLPICLQQNDSYFIPAKTYHRLIKGSDDLIIVIKEIKPT